MTEILVDGDMADPGTPDWKPKFGGNTLPDGRMSDPGVTWWATGGAGSVTLVKDPGVLLNIQSVGGMGYAESLQTVKLEVGETYYIELRARRAIEGPEGIPAAGRPQVWDGTTLIWDGSSANTDWQEYADEFVATDTEVQLVGEPGAESNAWVDFEYVIIRRHTSMVSKVDFGSGNFLRVGSKNIFNDGDMEAAGTTAWSVADGTLAKSTVNPHTGTQAMRCTWASGSSPRFNQTGTTITGRVYRCTAWCNTDGTVVPSISVGYAVWTGVSSAGWQKIEFTFQADFTFIPLFSFSSTSPGTWVEWDDLNLVELIEPLGDTDMENQTTAEWTASGTTALSKDSDSYSGGLSLRASNSGANALFSQSTSCINTKAHTIKCAYKGDGVNTAVFVFGGQVPLPFPSTPSWAFYETDFVGTTGSGTVALQINNGAGTGFGFFDNVSVLPIDIDPQEPPAAVTEAELTAGSEYRLVGKGRTEGISDAAAAANKTLPASTEFRPFFTDFLYASGQPMLASTGLASRSEWDDMSLQLLSEIVPEYGTNIVQEGDILVFQEADGGNIIVEEGITTMTGGFETMAYLSIFGGNEDDPGGQDTSKSWCGNYGEPPENQYRSETQHILRSLPLTSANVAVLQAAVVRDLERDFIDSGIASNVTVVVTIPRLNYVQITGTITAVGEISAFNFVKNWEAMAKS